MSDNHDHLRGVPSLSSANGVGENARGTGEEGKSLMRTPEVQRAIKAAEEELQAFQNQKMAKTVAATAFSTALQFSPASSVTRRRISTNRRSIEFILCCRCRIVPRRISLASRSGTAISVSPPSSRAAVPISCPFLIPAGSTAGRSI